MANENIKDLFNKMFEDKDQNGVPDMFEQKSADGQHNFQVFSSNKVNVNGKEYDNIDELPPEIKEKMKQAFSMLQNNKWMKNIVGTALNVMPEMNVDINPVTREEEKIQTASTTNYTTSTDIPDRSHINLRFSKKWLYAGLLIVVIFVVWLFNKK